MIARWTKGLGGFTLLAAATLSLAPSVSAQVLDDRCIVNVLNRTVPVSPDGSWSMPNVPSTMGQVRARVTCIQDGQTISGQTGFFTVARNGVVRTGEFVFNVDDPPPSSLKIGPPGVLQITGAGTTAPLAVTATFPDQTVRDVTARDSGINYSSTNPAIATVDADGAVTAVTSGSVLVTARLDGAVGIKRVTVTTSGDTDGDGLPDDLEIANGLNPNDPVDAFEDADKDGLTNREELLQFGTDIRNADSDGDGINDGEEVVAGDDGFVTNPLAADTDGDGVRDGLEVATGSDPTDANNTNLGAALSSIEVLPPLFTLTVDTIVGEASRRLAVTGHLVDGNTIDLTPTSRGTNYASSDLSVCNFGAEDGRVFAGVAGACIITVSNSGYSATASVVVSTFAPRALSSIGIPGGANNVDVNGNRAYVASGSTGLQIVDITDRNAPVIIGSVDTPGTANDVKLVGNTAYAADGAAGLQIIDVTPPANPSDPFTPAIIAAVATPGNALDVVVNGNLALVADGTSLQVIDISTRSIIGAVATPGTAQGVDVTDDQATAVVAIGTAGIRIVDLTDPRNPAIVGGVDTGDARDVVVKGSFAFVADFVSSFTSVDIADRADPVIRASTPRVNGGLLLDVAVAGNFAFGADIFFVNGVPIIAVDEPESPAPRAILNFPGDATGTGVAADSEFVYLTAASRLYIGQYRTIQEDTAGIPPTALITSPAPGTMVFEGNTVPIAVEATDDVAVAAVEFLVDGRVVFIDTTAPYQFSYDVPVAGVDTLVIGARAIDLANNIGDAPTVALRVTLDSDGDGVGDDDEVNIYGTDPNNADTDGDGLTDGVEINDLGTDPLDADSDDDGLTDSYEVNVLRTNPLVQDTDGDGRSDGQEILVDGTDPSDASDVSIVIALTGEQAVSDQAMPAVDGDGNIHVAWVDLRDDPTGEIYYKMLRPDGTTLIDDTRLSSSPDLSRRPAIGVDRQGHVTVVWRNDDAVTGAGTILHTKLDPSRHAQDGSPGLDADIVLVDDQLLSAPGDVGKGRPRLAVDGADRVHVVWERSSPREVHYARIDSDGAIGIADRAVFQDGLGALRLDPAVASDTQGDAHIAFAEKATTCNTEIFYLIPSPADHDL